MVESDVKDMTSSTVTCVACHVTQATDPQVTGSPRVKVTATSMSPCPPANVSRHITTVSYKIQLIRQWSMHKYIMGPVSQSELNTTTVVRR